MIFHRGTELMLIRVKGENIFFQSPHFAGGKLVPLELTAVTPALKQKMDILKGKIANAKTEDAIADILVDDMRDDKYELQIRRRF